MRNTFQRKILVSICKDVLCGGKLHSQESVTALSGVITTKAGTLDADTVCAAAALQGEGVQEQHGTGGWL